MVDLKKTQNEKNFAQQKLYILKPQKITLN